MKRSENILLLGLGGVGRYLSQRLSRDGHSLTVIDRNRARLAKMEKEIDGRLLLGDVLDFKCWEAARAGEMDYLIAVTNDDAVNVLAAKIAHKFGIEQKIVRVRSLAIWEEDAPLSAEDLGIDLVIRPAELAAQEIVRMLMMQAGNVILDVEDGYLQVVATHVHPGSALVGKRVRDLAEDEAFNLRVVCIARDIETLIPHGNVVIENGDHLYILTSRPNVPRVMRVAGVSTAPQHDVLIIGGGMVGTRAAELLEDTYPVHLIERDESRAEDLTYRLKRTECLHGDGSDGKTLLDAGLLRMDTIITATGDNETNIMSGVLAKHLIQTRGGGSNAESSKTITLVNRHEYLALATAMGADIAVSAKVLAGNQILRYIRRGYLLEVVHLHGCDAEMVELLPEQNAVITREPLGKMPHLRGKIMVGAVYRDGVWQVATGRTQLRASERVVCVCTSDYLSELQQLFLA